MRHCLIICALALSACGADKPPSTVVVRSHVPADLLRPCGGWNGPVPATEGQLILAAAAEKRGRLCANAKIEATAQIVGPQ